MLGRERLRGEGPRALSELELLSLLLGSGSRLHPAPAVAARLLEGGLRELRRARLPALLATEGLSEAQACRVVAGLELGLRAAWLPHEERRRLIHPGLIAARLWPRLAFLDHEEFWALLLNSRCEELRAVRISQGGLSHCSVLPREALAPALLHGAPCVAFAHNHPSGDPHPSPDDLRLQLHLQEAARTLGVVVVDHLVIAEGGIHSAREGFLPLPDAEVQGGDPDLLCAGPPSAPLGPEAAELLLE
jgi:DNA repair protein RadC